MAPMKAQTYAAAGTIAPRVHAHFARHLEKARDSGQTQVASLPDITAIEALIDAAFWASLRREEGYVPRISLAFVSPSDSVHPLIFERPLALDPATLTKVAPAVERAG